MTRASAIYLAKWILFASISSVCGIGVCYSFSFLLLESYALIARGGLSIAFFPILGALICGFIIYKIRPRSAGEGIPSYIIAVTHRNGGMTFTTSLYKYLAAFFTLATGGSGGIVGPLIRVGTGFVSFVGKKLVKSGLETEDRRIIVICGASAICASIFHAPVGAGLFAVEILKRANMSYLDLFPSILTSCFTITIIKFFDMPAIYDFNITNIYSPSTDIIWILLLGFISGFYSIAYIKFYAFIRRVMGRDNLKVKNLVGGALFVSMVGFFIHPELLGTSLFYVKALTSGQGEWPFSEYFPGRMIFILFFMLAVLKGITNCVTIGTGQSAGFTGPSMIMGLLLGASFASLLGISHGSGMYSAFLVAGMCGVLSSSVNIPLAAAIMGAEIFGPSYALPAAISSITAFQVARSSTLYDLQFKIDGKSKEMDKID